MKIDHDISALFFIFGSLSLLFLPELITGILFLYLSIILFCLLLCFYFFQYKARRWFYYLAFCLFGLLWASFAAVHLLKQASVLVDKTITVIATAKTINIESIDKLFVISEQESNQQYQIIHFNITHVDGEQLADPLRIQVQWSDNNTPVYAGQIWHLILNVRAIHSRLNEGAFDSQRWALSQHMLLTASVKQASLIYDGRTLRQQLISYVIKKIDHYTQSSMMIGLLFGERQRIDREIQKQLLHSGIGHLMAISGMHIMLLASLVLPLAKLCQWLLPVRHITLTMPLVASLCVAVTYAWLSGMNPPALRAIVAFTLYLCLRFSGINLGRWQLWLRIVALLILSDPLIILSTSFWLSCFAVASLIFLYQWFPLPHRYAKKRRWYLLRLCHLQFGLSLLLLPIQITIFHGVSFGGLLANLVAIPLTGLIILPLLFIGLSLFFIQCDIVSHIVWFAANQSLELMLFCASLMTNTWVAVSKKYSYIIYFGWISLIIWRCQLWRRFYLTCLLIILLMLTPFIQQIPYRWRVDMLDVGHGLAIIIRQGNDAIIYDTGQQYQQTTEAEKQIIPFLNWHNLKLQQIVLSHQHSDHSGGINVLKELYPDIGLISSSKTLMPNTPCIAGKTWQWQILKFEILWPPQLAVYAGNSDSCVIRVTDGQFSLLLTGDLEKNQELFLVKLLSRNLQSTILQIPHHGSNTSSGYAFLAHVNPRLAINSTARYNPWNLPSEKAIARYNKLNIPISSTSEQGQITLYFYDDHWQLAHFRQQISSRWFHDWFGALRKYR